MEFVINFEKENDTYLVSFPDISWVHTVGDDEEAALINALDALEAALESCIEDRTAFPIPSKARKGEKMVRLGVQASAKAYLHNEMITQQVRKSDLARKLKLHMPQVDRLLDIKHSTKIEALEQAFLALGKTIELGVRPA